MATYSYTFDRVETAASTNASNIVAYDRVYVAQGTNVSASGLSASGVKGVDHNYINVAGDIYSGYVAVYLAGGGGHSSIYVGATGAIESSNYGIYELGQYNTIMNGGTITGTTAISAGTGFANIHNTGLIQSDFLAVYVGGDATTSNSLVNTGDIVASGYSFYGNAGADSVVNKGMMDGNLLFAGGNDLLDSRGGTLVGQVQLGDGNDTAYGSDGADNIFGGNNDDILRGRGDDDRLDGGDGMDKLRGGDGEDLFIFSSTPSAATNADTIVDFTHGEDQIALTASIFAALGSDVSSGEFLSRAFGHKAFNHDQHIIYDRSKGTLWYDVDGHGGTQAVKFAQLGSTANHPTNIDYHDFTIV